MFSDKNRLRNGRQLYKLKKLRTMAAVFFLFIAVVVSVTVVLKLTSGVKNEKKELLRVWNNEDYEQAYAVSKNALNENPVDYFLLTVNGFSAYQLGISQINNNNTLKYIDDCIISLRKARLQKESSTDGRIFYVLGKAYSYKGKEYADLAVKYLELAKKLSYNAQDISEYLGLAYAACGDYRSSVEAFTGAFSSDRPPSDTLLLSIARSYMAMKEFDIALGYLNRCIDTTPDVKSVNIARLLQAEVYITLGEYDNAEGQYISILNDSGEDAEVHYQLGELYYLKGDNIRARSEWRIANRQAAHVKARTRLNNLFGGI